MQTKDKSKLCAVYFFVKLLWNGVAAPDFGKWYFFARNLFGICSEFVRDLFGMRAKKYYFCGIVKKSKKSLRL